MADIELVIKIPEEIYTHFMSRFKYQSIDDIGLDEFGKVGVAIKNGTPLPKGHGRLIDTDVLEETKEPMYESNGEMKGYGILMNDIRQFAPTIIEADKESE